jgi:hypothetical protein
MTSCPGQLLHRDLMQDLGNAQVGAPVTSQPSSQPYLILRRRSIVYTNASADLLQGKKNSGDPIGLACLQEQIRSSAEDTDILFVDDILISRRKPSSCVGT